MIKNFEFAPVLPAAGYNNNNYSSWPPSMPTRNNNFIATPSTLLASQLRKSPLTFQLQQQQQQRYHQDCIGCRWFANSSAPCGPPFSGKLFGCVDPLGCLPRRPFYPPPPAVAAGFPGKYRFEPTPTPQGFAFEDFTEFRSPREKKRFLDNDDDDLDSTNDDDDDSSPADDGGTIKNLIVDVEFEMKQYFQYAGGNIQPVYVPCKVVYRPANAVKKKKKQDADSDADTDAPTNNKKSKASAREKSDASVTVETDKSEKSTPTTKNKTKNNRYSDDAASTASSSVLSDNTISEFMRSSIDSWDDDQRSTQSSRSSLRSSIADSRSTSRSRSGHPGSINFSMNNRRVGNNNDDDSAADDFLSTRQNGSRRVSIDVKPHYQRHRDDDVITPKKRKSVSKDEPPLMTNDDRWNRRNARLRDDLSESLRFNRSGKLVCDIGRMMSSERSSIEIDAGELVRLGSAQLKGKNTQAYAASVGSHRERPKIENHTDEPGRLGEVQRMYKNAQALNGSTQDCSERNVLSRRVQKLAAAGYNGCDNVFKLKGCDASSTATLLDLSRLSRFLDSSPKNNVGEEKIEPPSPKNIHTFEASLDEDTSSVGNFVDMTMLPAPLSRRSSAQSTTKTEVDSTAGSTVASTVDFASQEPRSPLATTKLNNTTQDGRIDHVGKTEQRSSASPSPSANSISSAQSKRNESNRSQLSVSGSTADLPLNDSKQSSKSKTDRSHGPKRYESDPNVSSMSATTAEAPSKDFKRQGISKTDGSDGSKRYENDRSQPSASGTTAEAPSKDSKRQGKSRTDGSDGSKQNKRDVSQPSASGTTAEAPSKDSKRQGKSRTDGSDGSKQNERDVSHPPASGTTAEASLKDSKRQGTSKTDGSDVPKQYERHGSQPSASGMTAEAPSKDSKRQSESRTDGSDGSKRYESDQSQSSAPGTTAEAPLKDYKRQGMSRTDRSDGSKQYEIHGSQPSAPGTTAEAPLKDAKRQGKSGTDRSDGSKRYENDRSQPSASGTTVKAPSKDAMRQGKSGTDGSDGSKRYENNQSQPSTSGTTAEAPSKRQGKSGTDGSDGSKKYENDRSQPSASGKTAETHSKDFKDQGISRTDESDGFKRYESDRSQPLASGKTAEASSKDSKRQGITRTDGSDSSARYEHDRSKLSAFGTTAEAPSKDSKRQGNSGTDGSDGPKRYENNQSQPSTSGTTAEAPSKDSKRQGKSETDGSDGSKRYENDRSQPSASGTTAKAPSKDAMRQGKSGTDGSDGSKRYESNRSQPTASGTTAETHSKDSKDQGISKIDGSDGLKRYDSNRSQPLASGTTAEASSKDSKRQGISRTDGSDSSAQYENDRSQLSASGTTAEAPLKDGKRQGKLGTDESDGLKRNESDRSQPLASGLTAEAPSKDSKRQGISRTDGTDGSKRYENDRSQPSASGKTAEASLKDSKRQGTSKIDGSKGFQHYENNRYQPTASGTTAEPFLKDSEHQRMSSTNEDGSDGSKRYENDRNQPPASGTTGEASLKDSKCQRMSRTEGLDGSRRYENDRSQPSASGTTSEDPHKGSKHRHESMSRKDGLDGSRRYENDRSQPSASGTTAEVPQKGSKHKHQSMSRTDGFDGSRRYENDRSQPSASKTTAEVLQKGSKHKHQSMSRTDELDGSRRYENDRSQPSASETTAEVLQKGSKHRHQSMSRTDRSDGSRRYENDRSQPLASGTTADIPLKGSKHRHQSMSRTDGLDGSKRYENDRSQPSASGTTADVPLKGSKHQSMLRTDGSDGPKRYENDRSKRPASGTNAEIQLTPTDSARKRVSRTNGPDIFKCTSAQVSASSHDRDQQASSALPLWSENHVTSSESPSASSSACSSACSSTSLLCCSDHSDDHSPAHDSCSPLQSDSSTSSMTKDWQFTNSYCDMLDGSGETGNEEHCDEMSSSPRTSSTDVNHTRRPGKAIGLNQPMNTTKDSTSTFNPSSPAPGSPKRSTGHVDKSPQKRKSSAPNVTSPDDDDYDVVDQSRGRHTDGERHAGSTSTFNTSSAASGSPKRSTGHVDKSSQKRKSSAPNVTNPDDDDYDVVDQSRERHTDGERHAGSTSTFNTSSAAPGSPKRSTGHVDKSPQKRKSSALNATNPDDDYDVVDQSRGRHTDGEGHAGLTSNSGEAHMTGGQLNDRDRTQPFAASKSAHQSTKADAVERKLPATLTANTSPRLSMTEQPSALGDGRTGTKRPSETPPQMLFKNGKPTLGNNEPQALSPDANSKQDSNLRINSKSPNGAPPRPEPPLSSTVLSSSPSETPSSVPRESGSCVDDAAGTSGLAKHWNSLIRKLMIKPSTPQHQSSSKDSNQGRAAAGSPYVKNSSDGVNQSTSQTQKTVNSVKRRPLPNETSSANTSNQPSSLAAEPVDDNPSTESVDQSTHNSTRSTSLGTTRQPTNGTRQPEPKIAQSRSSKAKKKQEPPRQQGSRCDELDELPPLGSGSGSSKSPTSNDLLWLGSASVIENNANYTDTGADDSSSIGDDSLASRLNSGIERGNASLPSIGVACPTNLPTFLPSVSTELQSPRSSDQSFKSAPSPPSSAVSSLSVGSGPSTSGRTSANDFQPQATYDISTRSPTLQSTAGVGSIDALAPVDSRQARGMSATKSEQRSLQTPAAAPNVVRITLKDGRPSSTSKQRQQSQTQPQLSPRLVTTLARLDEIAKMKRLRGEEDDEGGYQDEDDGFDALTSKLLVVTSKEKPSEVTSSRVSPASAASNPNSSPSGNYATTGPTLAPVDENESPTFHTTLHNDSKRTPASSKLINIKSVGQEREVDGKAICGNAAAPLPGNVSKVEKKKTVSKLDMGSGVNKVEKKKTVSKLDMGSEVSKVEKKKTVSKLDMGSEVSKVEKKKTVSKLDMGSEVGKVEKKKTVSKLDMGSEVSKVEKKKTVSRLDMISESSSPQSASPTGSLVDQSSPAASSVSSGANLQSPTFSSRRVHYVDSGTASESRSIDSNVDTTSAKTAANGRNKGSDAMACDSDVIMRRLPSSGQSTSVASNRQSLPDSPSTNTSTSRLPVLIRRRPEEVNVVMGVNKNQSGQPNLHPKYANNSSSQFHESPPQHASSATRALTSRANWSNANDEPSSSSTAGTARRSVTLRHHLPAVQQKVVHEKSVSTNAERLRRLSEYNVEEDVDDDADFDDVGVFETTSSEFDNRDINWTFEPKRSLPVAVASAFESTSKADCDNKIDSVSSSREVVRRRGVLVKTRSHAPASKSPIKKALLSIIRPSSTNRKHAAAQGVISNKLPLKKTTTKERTPLGSIPEVSYHDEIDLSKAREVDDSKKSASSSLVSLPRTRTPNRHDDFDSACAKTTPGSRTPVRIVRQFSIFSKLIGRSGSKTRKFVSTIGKPATPRASLVNSEPVKDIPTRLSCSERDTSIDDLSARLENKSLAIDQDLDKFCAIVTLSQLQSSAWKEPATAEKKVSSSVQTCPIGELYELPNFGAETAADSDGTSLPQYYTDCIFCSNGQQYQHESQRHQNPVPFDGHLPPLHNQNDSSLDHHCHLADPSDAATVHQPPCRLALATSQVAGPKNTPVAAIPPSATPTSSAKGKEAGGSKLHRPMFIKSITAAFDRHTKASELRAASQSTAVHHSPPQSPSAWNGYHAYGHCMNSGKTESMGHATDLRRASEGSCMFRH